MSEYLDRIMVRLRSAKKAGLIILGLFLLYVVVGFWIAPPLVRPRLEKRLADMIGRKVTIATLKLNPLALSATIANLMVREKDGSSFAGFKALYVNVQASSLFRWAAVFKTIRLTSPFGTLKVMPKGELNIDDIIARLSQVASPSEKGQGLPRALATQLDVIDGMFTIADLSASAPIYDVIAPITFTLENLSTLEGREGEFHIAGQGPIGGTFDLKGNLELNPPKIQGRFTTRGIQLSHHWEHVKDIVSFKIVNGTMGVRGDFFAAIDSDGLTARLENGAFHLDNFELTEKGQKTVLVALPVFSAKGINADLKPHAISIDEIQTADARINAWLSADGTFTLGQMALSDLEKLRKKKAGSPSDTEAPPPRPWRVTLKKVDAANWGLSFEDRTLTRPATLSANGIYAVIENLSTRKDTQATIGVTMQVNQAGQVKVDGTASIDPLQADMAVVARKIALKPFQPYVDDLVKARITSGATSSTGHLRYMGKESKPQIRYDGEFSIHDLGIQDNIQTKDSITLAQFKAAGIALELIPNQLRVSDVRMDRPQARVAIDKAGMINLVSALTPVEKKKNPGTENLLQRLVNFLVKEFKGPMPIHVDRVRLERFSGDFVDASVSPTFNTRMEVTNATVNGLSSKPSARADFKLSGNIDGKSTFKASGQLNPMNALKYSKVDASLNKFVLNSISPYSGKYIGYTIAKGALQTDFKYKIDNDQVHGDNIITVDGLELGKKVKSPDALNLPIKLGVTLLKDKNDRIRVQVPVVGNVRDPHFDLAKTIKSALTGTIERAGSEPFTVIGKIDGFTGKALSVVAFDFGGADLTEAETKKLDALAKYLKAKDDLILGIVGTADRQMDMAVVMGKYPKEFLPNIELPENEDTPPEDDSVDGETTDNNRLEALAQQRTDTVSAYLIEQAGIASARIDVKPVQIKPEPNGATGRVEFSLSIK